MRVQEKSFYADMFTAKAPAFVAPKQTKAPALMAPPEKQAPRINQESRAEKKPAPAPEIAPEAVQEPAAKSLSPLAQLIGNFNARSATPRQVENLSTDLYAAGAITFEDHALLSFQPDLHPDFDRTIGALTGEQAHPDRPRDFVNEWDERAAFQRRHDTGHPEMAAQSERIAALLRGIDNPVNLTA